MTGLLVVLAGAYALSTLAGSAAGVTLVVPWTFLGLLGAVMLPLAHGICASAGAIESVARRSARGGRLLAFVLGVGLVAVMRPQSPAVLVACGALALWFLWSLCARYRAQAGTLLRAVAVLWVGYATVWSLNYLLALGTAGRLHDAALRDIDLAVYRALLPGVVGYEGLFPLVRGAGLVTALENAYLFLFVEIMALALTLAADRERLRRFLVALFGCYFIAILAFLAYPAVGPCIRYPESFDASFAAPMTTRLMHQMAAEYRAATSGGAVNGFAYFIAVPSLHVAVATLAQLFWARHVAQFWTFLPINVLMVLSTVLLGYHYLVDVPPAIALAAAVFVLSRRRPILGLTALRAKLAAVSTRFVERRAF